MFSSCTLKHCLANFPNSFWTPLCLNIIFIVELSVELLFKATDGLLYPRVLENLATGQRASYCKAEHRYISDMLPSLGSAHGWKGD